VADVAEILRLDGAQRNANGTAGAQPNGYPDAQTGAIWRGELSKKHREQLENESKISREAIEARGYFTATDANLLKLHGYTKAQALTPALVIPLWDFKGNHDGVAIRHTVERFDSPTGKKIKYDLPKSAAPTLDVSPLTRDLILDATKPLLITEGAKKADSAASRGLCAINLNGVWGFKSKDAPLPDWQEIPLRGRFVFIAYDSDINEKWGVEAATRRLHALLVSLGAVVKVIYLPDGPKDGRTGKAAKVGLDDYFAQGGTVEQLFMLARDLDSLEESKRQRREREIAEKRAEVEAKAAAAGVPLIETHNRQQREILAELREAFKRANSQNPTLFHGATGLVSVGYDNNELPLIEDMTREGVQTIAANVANWISTTQREGIKNIAPPRDLCANFAATSRNWKGLPALDAIVTAPFFDVCGNLCAAPGYHSESRVFLKLPHGYQLPDTKPTPANVAAAKILILQTLFGDVAFANESSRANAVALMIQPFVKRLIADASGAIDATPLYLWDAPTQKSGKSTGAKIALSPFGPPRVMIEKGETNDDEWRKAIFTSLAQGSENIFLDNVTGRLNSSTLAAAITEPTLTERVLGSLRNATVSTRVTWVVTSNNAQLCPDTASRAVMVRLDTNLENPEGRSFKLDPLDYIAQHRPQVQAAIITLIQLWLLEGRPQFTHRLKSTRFKNWARVIGGILDTAEIGGFLQNAEKVQSQLDPESATWGRFVVAWAAISPNRTITAARLVPLAIECEVLPRNQKDDLALNIGKMLQSRTDRIFAGFKIKRVEEKSRVVNWYLEPVLA
jgi:hypothetical protein